MSIRTSSAIDAIIKPQSQSTATYPATEVSKVDAALDGLLKLLPESPYYLNVPTISPLFDNQRARYDIQLEQSRWRHTYPHTNPSYQHASFLYRETTDSVFEIRTEVDFERERQTRQGERKGVMASKSRSATPISVPGTSAIKKKISLAAYKQKKEQGDTSERKDVGFKLPPVLPPPPASSSIASKQSEALQDRCKADSSSNTNDSSARKRKSMETAPIDQTPQEVSHASKKARASTPPLTVPDSDQSLPPLLSPILDDYHDARLYDDDATDSYPVDDHDDDADLNLPPLLSPTLPSDLEDELRRKYEGADSSISLPEVAAPPHTNNDTLCKQASKIAKIEPTKSSQKVPHGGQRHVSQQKKEQSLRDPPASKATVKMTREHIAKERAIVTLHYDPNASIGVKLVKVLCQDKPRLAPAFAGETSLKPKRLADTNHGSGATKREPKDISPESSRLASRNKPASSSNVPLDSGKKRLAEALAGDRLAKKIKAELVPNGTGSVLGTSPSVDHRPSTPVKDDMEAKRTNEVTTPREAQTGMVRSMSNISHASTPRTMTPMPPSRPNQMDRGVRISAGGAIQAKSKKYLDLGRDLKHRADKVIVADGSSTTTSHKLRAMLNLESVMSYMIGFSIKDTRIRNSMSYASTWLTLDPYMERNVRTASLPFPELEGLRCYLAYVIQNRITRNMINHLASTDPTNAPSPGAPTNPPVDAALPGKLVKSFSSSPRWIVEARNKLSEHRIQVAYPNTWAARELSPQDAQARDDPQDHNWLDGPYWLPISEAMTPVQAVCFGIKFCNEWMANEGETHRILLGKE